MFIRKLLRREFPQAKAYTTSGPSVPKPPGSFGKTRVFPPLAESRKAPQTRGFKTDRIVFRSREWLLFANVATSRNARFPVRQLNHEF